MPTLYGTFLPCAYCGQTSHLSQDCADCPKSLQSEGDYMTSGRYGPADLKQYITPACPPPWTKLGEDELRTARARVAELEARRAAAIAEVTRIINVAYEHGMTKDEFTAHMIDNADDIRDALAPFVGKDRAV